MMNKKLNSTTAILVALSFLQPVPGLAQVEVRTPGAITGVAFETALACLANFKGKPKEAEAACLEELKSAGIPCDPGLLQPDRSVDVRGNENGGSPDKIAERIVRAANLEACMGAAGAQDTAGAAAQAEADAQAATDAAALAAADAAAQAEAQARNAAEAAASEAAARAAVQTTECAVELVEASGNTVCADDMTQAEIAVVTAGTAAQTDIEVTTQTVTPGDTRSSQQEFVDQSTTARDGGLTMLESAGLLALGAVVVGAILQNGETVTANTGDRVVVRDEFGNFSVLKDDDVLVREPGSTVRTETYSDGSTRSFVTVSPCATSRAVAVSSPERCICQLSWSSTQPEYIA